MLVEFFPCLSLWINTIGRRSESGALDVLCSDSRRAGLDALDCRAESGVIYVVAGVALCQYLGANWLVFTRWRDRAWYMLRVNPLSLMIWWFLWIVPLAIGFRMYLRDEGLAWQRTEKIDANKVLIRKKLRESEKPRLD